MAEKSLYEIMNDMALGFEAGLETLAVHHAKVAQPLSEFDAFLELDHMLVALNKEYLEAKAQHKELVKIYGCDDAMAEVAADMEDSAWCAMQTRYLEVRAERKLMAAAQQMMRDAEQEYIEAQEKKAQEKSIEDGQRLIAVARYIEKMREINNGSNDYLLAVVVLLFNLLKFGDTFFHFRSSFNQYGRALAA